MRTLGADAENQFKDQRHRPGKDTDRTFPCRRYREMQALSGSRISPVRACHHHLRRTHLLQHERPGCNRGIVRCLVPRRNRPVCFSGGAIVTFTTPVLEGFKHPFAPPVLNVRFLRYISGRRR